MGRYEHVASAEVSLSYLSSPSCTIPHMKTATMTQSAAVVETPAAPVLRALNPRMLSIDIVLPVLNEAYVIARSVSTLHAFYHSMCRIVGASLLPTMVVQTAQQRRRTNWRYVTPRCSSFNLPRKAVAELSSKRGYRARPIFWPIWISTSLPI